MHHKKATTKKSFVIVFFVIILLGIGSFFFYRNYTQRQQVKENEGIIKTLVSNLSRADYEKVAVSFSTESLKNGGVTEEEIAEKYQNIYGGIGVKEIKIKTIQVEDQNVSYKLSMQTDLGQLKEQAFQTTIDKESQKINWEPSLIFPDMKTGDKVSYEFKPAVRGEIKDRNNDGLAVNGTVYNFGLVPKDMKKDSAKKVSQALEISEKTIENALAQTWVKEDSFVPLKTMVKIPENMESIAGLDARKETGRTYPLGKAAAHLIGYVGQVTAEDLEKNDQLTPDSLIGRSGLERVYDKQLRGQDGGSISITDNKGNEKSILQEVAVKDGESMQLTLDSQAQYLAYSSLNGKAGSSVVNEPKTGDLLALASSPSFDPNKMAYGISQKEYDAYEKDKNLPFTSRFAQGYAPGSTFKAVTAAIGLENGQIDPDEKVSINGLKWQKDASWGGYQVTRVSEQSPVDLKTALVYSDNIYMAQQTLLMGEKAFRTGLDKLIFDEELDLPIEMNPAQISSESSFDSEILLADTGYGQGELLLNPIQQLTTYSVFPNNGTIVYPKLLLSEETETKKEIFSNETIQTVVGDLEAVVTDPNGTAHNLNDLGIDLAAKTGTAEIKEKQDEKGQENSFLYAFDAENQKFSVLELLENKEEGIAAVDLVSELLQYLLTIE